MKKSAMSMFRRLPGPIRRLVVHLATPSFTVGAVAVLRRGDGRVAFVEQRHSLGWTLPGGLLKRGETAAVGLAREVEEELGIGLDPLSLPLPVAAVSAHVRRVDIVYFVDAPPGTQLKTQDGVEVTRTGWFTLDALPEVSEPTADILRTLRLV